MLYTSLRQTVGFDPDSVCLIEEVDSIPIKSDCELMHFSDLFLVAGCLMTEDGAVLKAIF